MFSYFRRTPAADSASPAIATIGDSGKYAEAQGPITAENLVRKEDEMRLSRLGYKQVSGPPNILAMRIDNPNILTGHNIINECEHSNEL